MRHAKGRAVILLLLGLAPAFSPSVRAHEAGTTRVVIRFDSAGRYTAVMVTDAASLVDRLETARHGSRARRPDEDLAGALDRLCVDGARHLTFTFDTHDGAVSESSQPPRCRLESSGDPGDIWDVPAAELTFEGRVPAGARSFRVRNDLTGAKYAITVNGAPTGNVTESGAVTAWADGLSVSAPIHLPNPAGTRTGLSAAALTYLGLGFTHIVPKGLDHILFVLGLFLLGAGWRSLLAQVTAFTAAHSVTLGLSIGGLVSLPAAVVEPLIALSIVYVAVENVCTSRLQPWRVALVFAFGLLHGLGFADVLRELTLPGDEFLTALLAFNGGVELGQLAVIAVAALVLRVRRGEADRAHRRIAVSASLAIAVVALVWTVERLSA